MHSAVIVDVVRTPSGKGKPGGALSGTHPADLLSVVLKEILGRNDFDPGLVDDVIAGCVSQAGEQALNIARTALLGAGFRESVPGTTIDRQCGSSQPAAVLAAQGMTGAYDVVIACGVGSMSRVPMGFAFGGRSPCGSAHAARYPAGVVDQAIAAEFVAAHWKPAARRSTEYSALPHQRASAAAEAGQFDHEIVPVPPRTADGGETSVRADETIRANTAAAGLAGLMPPFRDEAVGERFPEID